MVQNININKANLDEFEIFDVRCPFEWKEGVLENAKLVCLYDDRGFLNENFINEFKEKLENNKKIAFVCKAGQRSFTAAKMVEENLNLDSVNLDGGISSYKGKLKK